tara:strand:+ start:211 stop:609 length:399 start_codon:yes stop_codon:yes gene_type:complete
MPTYLYQHPETKEIIEVSQKISETHEYTDENGLLWNRVFTVPHASVPNMTRIDSSSEHDFMKKTQDFDGTIGDLMDASKDLSEKRKQERGHDHVQQKFFKKYSEDRQGLKHREDTSHLNSKYKPNSDGVIEI